jgi:site-specific recombinase XerD
VADATYNRYRVTLSSVYKRGIKNEKVAENPVKGTSQRKLDNSVIRWLKSHEEKAIRAAIRERIETATQEGQPLNAKHERHHMCELIVSIQTGMRASERYLTGSRQHSLGCHPDMRGGSAA